MLASLPAGWKPNFSNATDEQLRLPQTRTFERPNIEDDTFPDVPEHGPSTRLSRRRVR
jgi:hypothetical protein